MEQLEIASDSVLTFTDGLYAYRNIYKNIKKKIPGNFFNSLITF